MKIAQYHVTKAGPRLLNVLIDAIQIDCTITGPGMLVDELQLLTNLDAFTGCDAGFYREFAADLDATSFCGHKPPTAVAVRVEPHRLGAELSIDVGPSSMYQALIRIRTRSGRSFEQLFVDCLAGDRPEGAIAGFYIVRARSHHEHHASASRAIREHASGEANMHMEGGHGH